LFASNNIQPPARVKVCSLSCSATRRCYLTRSEHTRFLLLMRVGLLNPIQHLRMVVHPLATLFDRGFYRKRMRLIYSHCPTGRCFVSRPKDHLQPTPRYHLLRQSCYYPRHCRLEWFWWPLRSYVALSANRDLLSKTPLASKEISPSENGAFTSFTDISLNNPNATIDDSIDTYGPVYLRSRGTSGKLRSPRPVSCYLSCWPQNRSCSPSRALDHGSTISVTGELLPDRALTGISIATVESTGFLVWR